MGGLPPTSTTLNTSTSSWTSPERARAIAADMLKRASASRLGGNVCGKVTVEWMLEGLDDVWSFAADSVRRLDASVSRSVRSRSRSAVQSVLCVAPTS